MARWLATLVKCAGNPRDPLVFLKSDPVCAKEHMACTRGWCRRTPTTSRVACPETAQELASHRHPKRIHRTISIDLLADWRPFADPPLPVPNGPRDWQLYTERRAALHGSLAAMPSSQAPRCACWECGSISTWPTPWPSTSHPATKARRVCSGSGLGQRVHAQHGLTSGLGS